MTDERVPMQSDKPLPDDVKTYLAKIRETVKKSEALIETAELRMAETDRYLAQHGLTRDEVKKLLDKHHLTPEQQKEIDEYLAQCDAEVKAEVEAARAEYEKNPEGYNSDGDLGQRSKKLEALRHQFRL